MHTQECTKNILLVIDVCRELLLCADKGDIERNDESCGVLFGIARDAAYRIIDLAEKERTRHLRAGTWDSTAETLYNENKDV